MKKLLIASSVLALTASAAMAEVAVSGDGRFGVDRSAAGVSTVQGRVRVNFGLSATGDHGLTFGGSLRIGQNFTQGTSAGFGPQNGSVFLGANGFRITYGDIDGAVASRVALYGGGMGFSGSVGRPSTHAGGYVEGDSNLLPGAVRVEYTAGGFGISASDRDGVANSAEIAVSYSASGLSAAAGYSESGAWSVSATYAMGAYTVGILHTDFAAVGGTRVWGTYAMGATTLRATITDVAAGANAGTHYAIGASYSLGGGAAFHAAIGRAPAGTTGQVGVTFAF